MVKHAWEGIILGWLISNFLEVLTRGISNGIGNTITGQKCVEPSAAINEMPLVGAGSRM